MTTPPEEGKGPVPASPAPAPAQPADTSISLADFQRVQLRTGTVVEAKDHPNADRLLVLTVDLGGGDKRQLVAGIRGTYQAADMVGKQVVVVANLKPAMLRGVESQGMVLAATDQGSVVVMTPERPVAAGSQVK